MFWSIVPSINFPASSTPCNYIAQVHAKKPKTYEYPAGLAYS